MIIEEIKEMIKVNREICANNEDAALNHCPFSSCSYCDYIFGYIEDCPCRTYQKEYVKETVKKLIGEIV